MVLESLISPKFAERKPWMIFLYGMMFTVVSIILSLVIFGAYPSLIMVFFIVLGAFPLVYNTIKYEEWKDEQCYTEKKLLREHWKALEVFLFLFLGITVACALFFSFLPEKEVENLFHTQIDTYCELNPGSCENKSVITGNATHLDHLITILFNNLRVLLFCIVFSFLYGVGALFILTWNATVIGTAMGIIIRKGISSVALASGHVKAFYYFQFFSVSLIRYAPHGALEIAAYFIAGLAGSIISAGIIRHNFGTKKFETIILDATDLLLISIGVLLIAGVVEVYITPALFSPI